MYRGPAITPLVLCLALLGCSSEKEQTSSAVPATNQAASMGTGLAGSVPQIETPSSDRVARRPALQAPAAPRANTDLPLWPPPTAPLLPQPSPNVLPSTSEQPSPPWASPSLEPQGALPVNPGAEQGASPPTYGPALQDPNPLRATDAPQLNPLRGEEPTLPLATILPRDDSPSPLSTPITSLPQLPKPGESLPNESAPVVPQPAAAPAESVPLLPHAPTEEAPPAPPPRNPLSSPIVKSSPARLPRVSIYSSPKALAEAAPQFRSSLAPTAPAQSGSTPESIEPSGGAAPPPDLSQPLILNMGTRNPTAANPDLGNPEAASNDTVFPALPSASATEAMPRADEPADVPAFPAPAAPSPGISVEGPATEAVLPEAAPAPAAAPVESEPPTTESAAPVPAEVAPAAPLPIGSPDESVTSAVIPAAAASDDPFDVVRVFYGTDRRPVLLNEDSLLSRLIRFLPSMILIALSVIGIGVVLVSRKITWTIGTTALVILSVLSTWHGVSETIAIAEQANLEEPKYSADRSDRGRIDRGICEVSIPKTHDPGELESPTILRLETRFDPVKHITLRKTIRLQDRAFYDQIREQVARSPDREILVFVHGFNVSFEDAARRTAQMAHDLKLQGAPVFFSWPADRGFLLTYGKDEASVSWATPHLKEFLLDLVHETDAKAINLVAHSMGNRALTTALREIDLQMRSEAKLFNQVVLAAPDIDADDFRDNIAPAIQRTAKQVTLYASANDAALAASYYVHRNPRAGDASRGLVIAPGIVTIDVSNIDGGPWGHSYYGASDPVLRDLHLLLTSLPPERRTWLKMNQVDGQTYWAFKPLGTARTPAVMEPR